MKWQNDEQEVLKWSIFDLVRGDNSGKICMKMSIEIFMHNIDKFIDACNEGEKLEYEP